MKKRPCSGAFLHHDWLVGSVAGTDIKSAATLRLGLMLAEMPLRAGTLAAASQAGAASETLGSLGLAKNGSRDTVAGRKPR